MLSTRFEADGHGWVQMGRSSEVRSRGAHRLVFGEERKRERQLRCQRGRIENAIPCSISPTWQSEATHEAAASPVQRHGREVHRRLGATGSSCPDWCSASRARPHWQGASVNARSLGQDAKPPFPARRQEKSIQEPGQRGGKKKEKKVEKRTHRIESAGGCWPRCLSLSTLTRTRDETSSFSRDPLPEPYACDVSR